MRDNFDFIDTEHGIAAGASFGGYMVNWVQGKPLGRKFQALVTHDGVFIGDNMIATEELWFPEHEVCFRPFSSFPPLSVSFLPVATIPVLRVRGNADDQFNGTIWNARENYRRWDPSSPDQILNFATPHLVIHSSLDYRLPVTEGVGLFNVLQERGVPSRFINFPDENHW